MKLNQITDAFHTVFFVVIFYYLFDGAGWILASLGSAVATGLIMLALAPSKDARPH